MLLQVLNRLAFLVVGTVLSMVDASQLPLHDHHRWTVKLSETWNVGVPPRYIFAVTM